MERTFNMGVGMIAVLPPDDVDRAMAVLTAKHVPSWVIGEVRATTEADGRGAAGTRRPRPDCRPAGRPPSLLAQSGMSSEWSLSTVWPFDCSST